MVFTGSLVVGGLNDWLLWWTIKYACALSILITHCPFGYGVLDGAFAIVPGNVITGTIPQQTRCLSLWHIPLGASSLARTSIQVTERRFGPLPRTLTPPPTHPSTLVTLFHFHLG